MKKMILLAMMLGLSLCVSADNLIGKKWYKNGPKANIKIDPIALTVTMKNDGSAKNLAVTQVLNLNQQVPKPFTFSGESKGTDVSGDPAFNYCVYIDLYHQDGTKDYGKIISFSEGTHDWEKKSMTYTPKKAVKEANIYVLFRSMKGEASFRNVRFDIDK